MIAELQLSVYLRLGWFYAGWVSQCGEQTGCSSGCSTYSQNDKFLMVKARNLLLFKCTREAIPEKMVSDWTSKLLEELFLLSFGVFKEGWMEGGD